jgi:signal peptidase I
VPATPRPACSSLARVAAGGLLVGALALAAVTFVPAALGLQRYVVTGGSMTGAYDRGSIVFDRVVPTSSLRVGDVITYRPPRGTGARGLVTHRIVSIHRRRGGRLVFRTKGDANPVADPWRFTLGRRQARVVASVPLLGWAFAALAVRQVRMLALGLPALLVALFVLVGLWREAGAEAANPIVR